MREINFRGETFDGRTVYGDLVYDEYNRPYIGCIVRNEFLSEAVNSESVAQFVGYDCDGNEVYEGDELVDGFGLEWTAKIHQGAGTGVDWTPYSALKRLKLKK